MDKKHIYPDIFMTAVNHLLMVEGGYVNDPSDRGGETKYGISKRQYPELDIKNLTKEQAVEIYYLDYWQAYHCDKISPAFALFLFDAVVNHRPKTAVKFLQQTVNVTVDGIIGNQTITALNLQRADASYIHKALIRALAFRADFYHDLCVENPAQERFLMGWLRRLFSLQQFILTEVNHGID